MTDQVGATTEYIDLRLCERKPRQLHTRLTTQAAGQRFKP